MRRQMIMSGLVVAGVAMTLGFPLAQENVAEIEQVKANLYVITGGGGNTAALVADDGVVLVDTKNPGWGSAILNKGENTTWQVRIFSTSLPTSSASILCAAMAMS